MSRSRRKRRSPRRGSTGVRGTAGGLGARVTAFLASGFGVATLACLLLAGWALWSAGIGESAAARQVRSSSVWVTPGVDVDRAAAERIIDHLRLVVLMLSPGADRRAACDEVRRAAAGTLVLTLTPGAEGYDRYACFLINTDDEHFGRAFVAEDVIGRGVDAMADRPLEALKVVVVNYDLPRAAADYIHRIGRTGRAGASGQAISFVSAESEAHFRLIEKRQGKRVPREQLAEFVPSDTSNAAAVTSPDNGGIKGKRPSRKDRARAAAAPGRPATAATARAGCGWRAWARWGPSSARPRRSATYGRGSRAGPRRRPRRPASARRHRRGRR